MLNHRRITSVGHETADRARRRQIARHAAEDPFAAATVPIGAGNKQVRMFVLGELDQSQPLPPSWWPKRRSRNPDQCCIEFVAKARAQAHARFRRAVGINVDDQACVRHATSTSGPFSQTRPADQRAYPMVQRIDHPQGRRCRPARFYPTLDFSGPAAVPNQGPTLRRRDEPPAYRGSGANHLAEPPSFDPLDARLR